MRILFIDITCPKPYAPDTLVNEAMGGTESTVVRVAESLASLGHTVVVSQHCRSASVEYAATYGLPFGAYRSEKFDFVVLLREWSRLSQIRFYFPRAKLFCWQHDLAGPRERQHSEELFENNAELIAVSDWHKNQISEVLLSVTSHHKMPRIHRVYNPIEDSLQGSGETYDKNKLVYCSSPHKGLARTLELFRHARAIERDLVLHVANPGYLEHSREPHPGVVYCDKLFPARLYGLISDSLCVFYPGTNFPETFGLVFGQSNGLGVPVLAHQHGAASEVLGLRSGQVIDCRDNKKVIDTLLSWRDGNRPTVTGNPKFRLSTVTQEWVKLLKA